MATPPPNPRPAIAHPVGQNHDHRRTRIVATLGPASSSPEVIRTLIQTGVDVFRLNASHGIQQTGGPLIRTIREAAAEAGTHTAILLDLQGPKIRLGTFPEGPVRLIAGETFTITVEEVPGNGLMACTTYAEFARDVRGGDRVLIADGAVELAVIRSNGTEAQCQVVRGGMISDRKGINLPGTTVSAPSMTPKDFADLDFGLEQGVDMVALSFVRRAADVIRLRRHMEAKGSDAPIVAKIEKPEAWGRIDEILHVSDGVMVARGDLGVEVALEHVPHIQKGIIEKARKCGRFVITATQMLESMIESAVPTRAEVSDVANAVYDGTDAIMLSAETATGRYPVEAVRTMSEIACATEQHAMLSSLPLLETAHPELREIVADAACRVAGMAGVKAIAVFTVSGSSAHLIASRRPPVPVFSFTTTDGVARRLSIWYAITPVVTPELHTVDEMLASMDQTLLERGRVTPGQHILFVAGDQPQASRATNTMKIHTVAVP
jgi:pyruvate kinase